MAKNQWVDIAFQGNTEICIPALWQYDHGLSLRFIDLPAGKATHIHYANADAERCVETQMELKSGHMVAILPDVFLTSAKEISAYLYLENEKGGRTTMQIRIPVVRRGRQAQTLSFSARA